jgi:dihydroorotate dehydrogenase (NAD+) catalytic subunit
MGKIDLSADLVGLKIDPGIMNASGIISYVELINELSPYLGAGVLKTTGVEERLGNETPIFCEVSAGTGLNAVGLPDPGYKEIIKEMEGTEPHIPMIASVSGRTEDEMAEAIEGLDPFVDAFELNYSCGNVKPGEKVGVEIGYNQRKVKTYTRAARLSTAKQILVKLPPAVHIISRKRFLNTAEAALKEGASGFTETNTIPGCLEIDVYAESPVLSAKYGSLSGEGARPFGLACIYTLYEAFPEVPLIGVGGISKAEDFAKYIMAGASAVQIGTALCMKNTGKKKEFLAELTSDLELLIDRLGYSSLKQLKGRAHGKK